MEYKFILTLFLLLQLAVGSAFGQDEGKSYGWAVAVKEYGKALPCVYQIICVVPEKTHDGKVFYRATSDTEGNIGLEAKTVQLPYGVRLDGKKILVYDFDQHKEQVAFDFTLSVGDGFTTVNGMEWEVIAKKDTVTAMSDEPQTLLTVRSKLDNRIDRWLENYGSFSNCLMLSDMSNVEMSRTLWMGCIDLSRDDDRQMTILSEDINEDPLYGHDTQFFGSDGEPTTEPNGYRCTYDDNVLNISHTCYRKLATRYYDVYYRIGDDIYLVASSPINGAWCPDGMTCTDNACLTGLPHPSSGSYTIHFGNEGHTTGLSGVVMPVAPSSTVSDLHGRRMSTAPERGVYIEDGKVRVVR